MRIGLQLPVYTWPGGNAEIGTHLRTIGKTADELGFASLWVMDHFFQIPGAGQVDEPMLESYSTLGFLAGVTKQARLGALVTGVVYRNPGILVKTVTTLDVVSGGRAYFGLGAAWNEREARGLGVHFPPVNQRFEQLEETIQIAKQMWAGTVAPFKGRHYHLEETLNSPPPVTKPHPPILIGGGGEKKTLHLVAKYADACNLFAMQGPEAVKAKLDVLRRHCDKIGRPYDEIERTALGVANLGPGGMTVSQMIRYCNSLAGVGIQHLILIVPGVHEIHPLEVIGKEIIPAVTQP